ncbi:MAG: DUF1844 domain-containing protein [Terriglobales bacterium]
MPEHDHEHDEPVLRVSDRRHFTEAGDRRSGVETVAFEEGPPQPAASKPAAASPPAPGKAPEPKPVTPAVPPSPARERLASREISFIGLIQDLYATGLMQMGAQLQPGQAPSVDLEGARETIDLLGMLEQKTRGNLDAQEQRLLAMALDEMRLAYVDVKQAGNRVQPAVMAPPPPPPGRRR